MSRMTLPAALRRSVVVAALLALAACDLPRDPGGTTARVRAGTVRVGVVHNPPWATVAAGEPRGVEPALVAELARRVGARVEWVPGGESELLAALEARQLELVVGGLAGTGPWQARLGLTRPFYTDSVVVGVRPGAPAPVLRGARVGVEHGTMTGAVLEGEGATPVTVASLRGFAGPVAGPAWRLEVAGFRPSGPPLHREPRAWAVPPGENGWLATVERFLAGREGEIGAMLRREEGA